MINYVDKMADALVDVLKYSNQDVEWVEPDDMKPNDGVQPEWFYPAIECGVFRNYRYPAIYPAGSRL